MMCTTTSIYLLYEFMHFCCHVGENAFVRNCPFVNTLRRHHIAHHNTRLMMETNMNLTFPIADWLFGTSDLDRGLLGHLFNGYSSEHLKTDLRGRPVPPADNPCAIAKPIEGISRAAQAKAPRSSWASAIFNATSRSKLTCWARKTTPIAPRPNSSMSS